MRRHHHNIFIALTIALAASAGLGSCTDEAIYNPPEKEKPTDNLLFNLPEVNEWKGSRADTDPDWLEKDWREHNAVGTSEYWNKFDWNKPTSEQNWELIRQNRHDNRLFKRYFVTVGANPDVSTPSDSTSLPYFDTDGDGKGDPGSYHKDIYDDHMVIGERRTATYSLMAAGTDESVGRVTMEAQPMTEKLMKRLEALAAKKSAGAASRGYAVDNRNVTERYKDISVTGYCYTTCATNDEQLKEMECFQEHREHNHKVELMYDTKVSYSKNATGDGLWQTDTTYYWTQMIGGGNRIRFFAYAPYGIAARTPQAEREQYPMILDPDQKRKAMDTPELDYLVPRDPKNQQDLSATAVTCPTDYSRTVPLKFNHLLTGVRFLIDDYYMGTCITSLKIKGLRDHGKYTWSQKPDNLATSADDKELEVKVGDPVPDYNNVHLKGTWEVDEEKDYVEYEFTKGHGLLDKPIPNELDGDQCRWEIIDYEYLLLLMPQILSEKAEIEVTFNEVGKGEYKRHAYIDGRSNINNPTNVPPDEWHQGEMITYIISTWDIEYVLKLVKAGGVYPYPGGYDNKTVVSYAIYYQRGTDIIQKIIPCPWEPEFYDAKTGEVIEKPDWVKVTYDRPDASPTEYIHKDGTTDNFSDPSEFIEDFVCHGHVDVMRYGAQQWGGHSDGMTEPLANATIDNPMNLAVYNSFGHKETGPENSANCYIINQPGYYKFPMVYGNGIKDGAPNENAWTEESPTEGYRSFVDAINGQQITGAKLPPIADAALITTNAQYAVQLVKVDQDYLTIYVDPSYIDQGNTILGVRNSDGTILWSWHIWTTDYDPYADKGTLQVPVATEKGVWEGYETFEMMRFNLGWHRPDQGDAGDGVTPRRVMWRPVQTHYTEGQSITRTTPNYYYIEQDPYEGTKTGVAPFYNWGRKDPLMKAVHTAYNQAFILDLNSYYFATYSLRRTYDNEELTSTLNGKTYKLSDGYYFFNQLHPQWAVALPWAIPFCYDIDDPGATRSETRGMTWWNGPSTSIAEPVQVGSNTATDGNGMPIVGTTGKPGNSCMASNMVFHPELWCHGQKKDSRYLSRESGRNVIKTIYDPCPPHFTVPPARAMSFLISSNSLKGSVLSQYMQLKPHLCFGYTFYKDYDAKMRGIEDDDHTVSLPAMPFLSPLAGESSWDKKSNIYCLPYLSTFMNRSCSLWEADISDPARTDYGYLSSYYNITGLFGAGLTAAGDNGMGLTETKSTWSGHRSTGTSYNNTGRQIRPVREK